MARLGVVHLLLTMDVGGLERVACDLARLSDPDRCDARILCLREPGALASQAQKAGLLVESLGARGLLDGLPRLARRLRQLRPTILHTHNPGSHRVGVPARLLAGVPVLVHTKHGRNRTESRSRVALNRWLARFSDVVVAVSEDAAQVAVTVERIPAAKVRVIHNGIELGDPLPSAAWEAWRPKAITVARLDPVKDQATMLRAARLIVEECPGFRLDLVGDGPSRIELTKLAGELGLGDHVRFIGYRTDVGSLLRRPQLFLLSSLSEGISLTLLEAMAAGLPVVATDAGGCREVVAHEVTGLLVPARSPEALANAALRILQDASLASTMGAAARSRAEAKFDLRSTVQRYELLYNEFVELATIRTLPQGPIR